MVNQPTWSKLTFLSNPRFYLWLPIAVFGLLVALFNGPYLFWFPQGIHEWAQSDRLALAYGFFDNGFDFFRPRTFSLISNDGIVGVEFPLQSYLTALLSLLAGRQHLSLVFRLLDNVMLIAGCCYLFWLVFAATRNTLLALVPGAFLLTSTFFVYYAGNYLPDPFSVSLVFVAFYYIYRFYYHNRRSSDLILGLGIATLAALVKLSAIVYLGSIALLLFTASYLNPRFFTLRQKFIFLLLMLVSLLLIGGWILYMRWLNTNYNAWIFLAEAKPLSDQAENDWVLQQIQNRWMGAYLSSSGYWVLRACLLSMVVYAGLYWRKGRSFLAYMALTALSIIGAVLFYVMMGPQFVVHDYYMIMPAVPVAVLLVLGGLVALHKLVGTQRWLQLGYILVIFLLLNNGFLNYRRRMNDPDGDPPVSLWSRNGAAGLTKIGVSEKERILVISPADARSPAYSPNVLLTHLQRRGLVFSKNAGDLHADTVLKMMTERQMHCIVVSTDYFRNVRSANPDFLMPFRVLGSDDQRTVLLPRQPLENW